MIIAKSSFQNDYFCNKNFGQNRFKLEPFNEKHDFGADRTRPKSDHQANVPDLESKDSWLWERMVSWIKIYIFEMINQISNT